MFIMIATMRDIGFTIILLTRISHNLENKHCKGNKLENSFKEPKTLKLLHLK